MESQAHEQGAKGPTSREGQRAYALMEEVAGPEALRLMLAQPCNAVEKLAFSVASHFDKPQEKKL